MIFIGEFIALSALLLWAVNNVVNKKLKKKKFNRSKCPLCGEYKQKRVYEMPVSTCVNPYCKKGKK